MLLHTYIDNLRLVMKSKGNQLVGEYLYHEYLWDAQRTLDVKTVINIVEDYGDGVRKMMVDMGNAAGKLDRFQVNLNMHEEKELKVAAEEMRLQQEEEDREQYEQQQHQY